MEQHKYIANDNKDDNDAINQFRNNKKCATSMKMQEKQRKQIYNNQQLQQRKIGQNNDKNTSKTSKTTIKSIKIHNQNASNQPVQRRITIAAAIINNIGMVMLLIMLET
jgi:hypothetical protein